MDQEPPEKPLKFKEFLDLWVGSEKTLRRRLEDGSIPRNEELQRLTAHGFRHYFVSWCANRNVPQLSVMNWLGHSTQRMTNYYYHANDAASLKHMRDLEAAEVRDQC